MLGKPIHDFYFFAPSNKLPRSDRLSLLRCSEFMLKPRGEQLQVHLRRQPQLLHHQFLRSRIVSRD